MINQVYPQTMQKWRSEIFWFVQGASRQIAHTKADSGVEFVEILQYRVAINIDDQFEIPLLHFSDVVAFLVDEAFLDHMGKLQETGLGHFDLQESPK